MQYIQVNFENAKFFNLENTFISINEAKKLLRCSREIINGLIKYNLIIANNRGNQQFLNKADLQLLIIKLTEPDYPNNFGKNKNYILKYFPINTNAFY